MSNQPKQEQIQRDLEEPLLENIAKTEIHTAIVLEFERECDDDLTIIDGRCNLVSRFYVIGFILGGIIQAFLLSTVGLAMQIDGNAVDVPTDLSVGVFLVLYLFSRYWVLLALLVPPIACTIYLKFRERKLKKIGKHALMKRNMKSFFECIRFQLGLFFGSMLLLSLANFISLARSTPIDMLLGYYGICVGVSLFALGLFHMFVSQVCANVWAVEIIVNYNDEKDEEDKE